jgi:hypothetical protein
LGWFIITFAKDPVLNRDSYEKEGSDLKIIELNENLKLKINENYKRLLRSNFPFDAMSWALAEMQLIFEKGHDNYTEKEVIRIAKKIIDIIPDYDTLCWLTANFKVYLEEIGLYP